uniref:Dynein light chain n=1 Tax=Macrostomum lignano TaxID=282301 RepID=A0A1I8FJ98_9PLAT
RLDTRDAPHPAQPAAARLRHRRGGAPSRPSSASHAILAAAATAGLLMAAGAPTGQSGGSSRESDSTSGLGGLTSVDRDQTRPHASPQKIPLKDFSSEIRANMDIQRFLKEATLLLDVEGANVECIIEQMLRSIFRADHESHHSAAAAAEVAMARLSRRSGWRHRLQTRWPKCRDAKKTPVLAKRSPKAPRGHSETEHPGESRAARPEGVSFILLVVTPTKEKGTRRATSKLGRTFATILADSRVPGQKAAAGAETEFLRVSRRCCRATHHELGEEQKIYKAEERAAGPICQWHPSGLESADFRTTFRLHLTVKFDLKNFPSRTKD